MEEGCDLKIAGPGNDFMKVKGKISCSPWPHRVAVVIIHFSQPLFPGRFKTAFFLGRVGAAWLL